MEIKVETLTSELLSCLSLYDRRITLDHFLSLKPRGGVGLLAEMMTFDSEVLERAQRTRDWCRENQVTIVHPDSEHYPESFFGLEKPPLFLSVLGSLKSLDQIRARLAIVGTRTPTERSLEWLDHHLSRFLMKRPAVVVSGGAWGIDQKVHRVAIRQGCPTLIFLPSGLERIYPSDLLSWREAVLETGGAFISCYAPEQEIRRSHFEGRNRLIAALSQVVLVAEARRRSGSIMTARLASELGRTLAVLPSFPGEPQSMGTLDLLFDGAFPLRDTEDLLALFDYGQLALSSKRVAR